jgi:hypothetical protein
MNTNTNIANTTRRGAVRLAGRVACLLILALATVWAQAGSASAQLSGIVRVKVPFAFTVGDTTLPAGAYSLRPVAGASLVLRGEDGANLIFSTTPLDGASESGATELSFNRYGDTYFLTGIRPVDAVQSYRVPASDEEIRLANTGAVARVVTVRVVSKG